MKKTITFLTMAVMLGSILTAQNARIEAIGINGNKSIEKQPVVKTIEKPYFQALPEKQGNPLEVFRHDGRDDVEIAQWRHWLCLPPSRFGNSSKLNCAQLGVGCERSEAIRSHNTHGITSVAGQARNGVRPRNDIATGFLQTQNTPSQTPKVSVVTQESNKADVATITLKIADPCGGAGFHLLLDEHHLLYEMAREMAFEDDDYDFDVLYSECEYRIPEDAGTDFTTFILNGQGSVDIPEGIYDFMVTDNVYEGILPVPFFSDWGDYIYDQCDVFLRHAILKDCMFKAGLEYVVTIEFIAWRVAGKFAGEHDATLTKIILPSKSPNLSNQEEIKVVLFNNGEHPFSNVELSYRINDGSYSPVETFTGTLAPGAKTTYTFNTKADFSTGGLYKVEARVDYDMDTNPFNDVVFDYTRNSQPQALPFVDDFEIPKNYDENCQFLDWEWNILNWSTIDANGDGVTWEGGGSASSTGSHNYLLHSPISDWSDDYLISDPIIIPAAGAYHISFYKFISDMNDYDYRPDSLRILYGTSPNPVEMDLLAEYHPVVTYHESRRTEWGDWEPWDIEFQNFEIETPGIYYFAFHYHTTITQPCITGLMLDDVTIAAGKFVGVPDIKFNHVLAPFSCNLTAEGVLGAEIYNRGTEPVSEFTLTYQIGNATPVSQTFTQTIGVREAVTVYFDQKADFSSIGEYHIKMTAATPNEENTSNNEMEVILWLSEPVTELPFESIFPNPTDYNNWTPGLPGRAWKIDPNLGYYVENQQTNQYAGPLLSKCITLQPDIYHFTYKYVAGIYWADYVKITCDFYVAYGKSGTDPLSWTPVKEYYNCYTDHKVIEDEITITITEAGEYIFGIFAERANNFDIRSISISEIAEHDFRINDIASLFPRMTPKYHVQGEHTFTATVENRGRTATESGTIELFNDNNILGSENFSFTEMGEVKDIDLNALFGSLPIGAMSLKFEAFNDYGVNDVVEASTVVSDSTFAYDNIDGNFNNGIGASGIPISMGLIYELQKTDILTSIDVGLFDVSTIGMDYSNKKFGLAVYAVNDKLELGECFLDQEYIRTNGDNKKAMTFDVPDTELPPGKYFVAVKQLDWDNIALAFDNDAKAYYYLFVAGQMSALEMVSGFGYVHVRPNFGNPPVGIDDVGKGVQCAVYPNPTNGQLIVECRDAINGISTMNIEIFDVMGRTVGANLAVAPDGTHQSQIAMDISHLPTGIYFLRIQTETGVVVRKVIKQ